MRDKRVDNTRIRGVLGRAAQHPQALPADPFTRTFRAWLGAGTNVRLLSRCGGKSTVGLIPPTMEFALVFAWAQVSNRTAGPPTDRVGCLGQVQSEQLSWANT